VGLVEVLAAATGTTVSAITDMAIAADAALGPALPITLLGLMVGLPATHLFVQRSIERATGGVATVALTTIIVGAFGPIELIRPDLPHSDIVTGIVLVAIALPTVAATVFDRLETEGVVLDDALSHCRPSPRRSSTGAGRRL
jgi:uncharacterized membrane protein YhaH (DUF805 family)